MNQTTHDKKLFIIIIFNITIIIIVIIIIIIIIIIIACRFCTYVLQQCVRLCSVIT